MFIKKDTRKIPEILTDATRRASAPPSSPNPANDSNDESKRDIVKEMRFARRAPEFLPSCGVSALLLPPKYRPALDNLIQLSLYDCGLQTLAGIENSFDEGATPLFPQLTSLDIGRNPKLKNDSLPSTFYTQFPQLTQLWSDDCSFGPNIPSTLLDLQKLQVVRMTGNRLEGELEDGIGIRYWKMLKVLALDGNKLTSIGRGLGKLKYLEKIQMRGNELTSLPEGVPSRENSSLVMMGLSSNKLSALPDSLVEVGATLRELYVNGNKIDELPEGLAEKLVALKNFNLAHNSLGQGDSATVGSQSSTSEDGDVIMEDADSNAPGTRQLPRDFVDRFGMPEPLTGQCTKEDCCVVRMEGNPMAELIRKKYLEEEKRKAKAKVAAMEAEVIE
eukprot:CAMPEP_0183719880 /NCGR_PEP_ID=MMETSP0737-20130205/12649_1 /TAXON_ID=385413 /ORGANISM="Thalassiosira miniscula, Strain CCMP1093" /LENGTH=388 /DNA_ID=CAMNT_0025949643 /DNA_START=88 /DNA_END=1254 /DNA_ORIENTATION=+